MSSAAFASLVLLPTIIDETGAYRTRGGGVAHIIKVSRHHLFACHGHYDGRPIEDRWHKSGRLYFSQQCDNDIVGKAAGR